MGDTGVMAGAALLDFLPAPTQQGVDADGLLDAIIAWAAARDLELYPHQEEAIIELLAGSNVVLATPTGSGKSLVALAAHARSLCGGGRSWYTAPVKALVSEKFFELCRELGAENVGLLTGDSAVNAGAPVICCTTEILALAALRDGADLDAETVILDEFHFYGDQDRGWAWQVPLIELPQSSFLLLSATLGDTRWLRDDLSRRTGRPTALVADAIRPVPLRYEYRSTLLHHTIEELLAANQAPLYVVNFSQRDAVSEATNLASVAKLDAAGKEIVAAELADAKMPPGFGRDLARLLRNGVGVHHAGMLPRYRRLVERLTQRGVLRIVSGTDTLGVGVNLPIRTVVLTRLYKYDGSGSRLLTAREFHQIAGRAGRAGYDAEGLVVAQAPDHVAANLAAEAKAARDSKKARKLRKTPPPKGFVHYDEATFERLQSAPPEPLGSSFAVTPGMMMQLLDRPGSAWDHGRHLLFDNHEPRERQRRHARTAISLYKALRTSGVVRERSEPDEWGRWVEVDHELQDDFALDQLLAPYLLHALPTLDRDDDGYPYAVLALVEAVVDNPMPVLFAQRDRARDEAMAAMKADHVPYEERIERLEKINYPQPLRDEIYASFDEWRVTNPWIGTRNIAPKGVVREMWDAAMDFATFVRHYGLKRSEGALLRYLSDVYKVLVRSVPDELKSDDVDELIVWLGAVIRATDSSLLDEWTALRDGRDGGGTGDEVAGPEPDVTDAGDITVDRRAFRVLVRTQVFRWVVDAATRQWSTWADDLADAGDRRWNASRLADELAPYFDEHDDIGIAATARGSDLFQVRDGDDRWVVDQVLDDPDGFHEWSLGAEIDLAASAEAGAVVATFTGLHRR